MINALRLLRGNVKEIYVVESENEIAGFVILQVCGTFSGYIQTICIGKDHRGKGFGRKAAAVLRREDPASSLQMFLSVCLHLTKVQ